MFGGFFVFALSPSELDFNHVLRLMVAGRPAGRYKNTKSSKEIPLSTVGTHCTPHSEVDGEGV